MGWPSVLNRRAAPVPGSTMIEGLPPQFLARALAIVVGLALLLVVNVAGTLFYAAWALIAIAFLSELSATLVFWRRARNARGTSAD